MRGAEWAALRLRGYRPSVGQGYQSARGRQLGQVNVPAPKPRGRRPRQSPTWEDKGRNGEVEEGNVALRKRSSLEACSYVVGGADGEEWPSDQEGKEGGLRQAAVDARVVGVERVRH